MAQHETVPPRLNRFRRRSQIMVCGGSSTAVFKCILLYACVVNLGVMPMAAFGEGGSCDTAGVPFMAGKCIEDEFECCNGKCIPQSWVDNGYDNCGDSSDEPNKPLFTTCACKELNQGLVNRFRLGALLPCYKPLLLAPRGIKVDCKAANLTKVPAFNNPDVTSVCVEPVDVDFNHLLC